MSDFKRLIRREANARRDRLRGTIASEPALRDFDQSGARFPTWVVDVDIGVGRLLRDVPIKINGPQARLYAKLGLPVFLERDALQRWQVVSPADRVVAPASLRELNEDTEVFSAAGTRGITVTREPFSFYQGETADQPITAFDVGADVDLLVWVDFGERSAEIPELPLAAAQVPFWPDRSSNANDLRQATGTQQPLYRRNTAGSNGRPATDYDGGNDRLVFASNIPGEQLSIFAMCRRDSALSTPMSVVNTEEYTLRIANTSPDEWAVGAGGGQNNSGSTIATGSFVLLEAICNAFNDIDMYQDGVFQATGTLAATGNGFTSSAIGAEPGTAAELNGRVAEVIILDRAVNDTDRQAIESYFSQKYNVRFSRWNNGVTPFPAIIRRDQDGTIL